MYVKRTLVIALDISENLLRNYLPDLSHQRIIASVVNLPFRSSVSEEIYSIAVIHHLESHDMRLKSLKEFHRVNSYDGETIISVWRKWRAQLKDKLIKRIKESKEIQTLVDHRRPWKDSTGNVLGTRFYHYYTWKELNNQINLAQFIIKERKIMGGHYKDGNFLVRLLKN
ncbi:MAG: hypothetical protein GPJ54_20035 [Candidatus Heimdallarchaeota archaeon]|nr:hypothetical protein [Candidatus Heimdallarchaeota archaeon]